MGSNSVLNSINLKKIASRGLNKCFRVPPRFSVRNPPSGAPPEKEGFYQNIPTSYLSERSAYILGGTLKHFFNPPRPDFLLNYKI